MAAAVIAQPGMAMADSVSTTSFTASNVTAAGPAADSEFFAGYAAPVGSKKTINTNLPVAKTGRCNADRGVVGESLVFSSATGGAAGAFAFSACAGGEQVIFVRLLASDGDAIDVDKPTKAGDEIKVTITDRKGNNKVVAENVTQGWTESIKGPILDADNLNVGESTVTLDGAPLPIQDFGSAKFTGVKVGGDPLKATDPTKFDCVDGDGPRMTTTKINDGTDFTVKFQNP